MNLKKTEWCSGTDEKSC